MRRIILVPDGGKPETLGLPALAMTESIWEDGYPLVMDEREDGILESFWKHYYGTSAEMAISGNALAAFRRELLAAAPACAARPEVMAFLLALARWCARARRTRGSLHVIAD